MRTVRALRLYGAAWLGLAALCMLGGVLFSHFQHGMSLAHAVAWALWIGGCVVVLLVGQSGSPTRMAGESRVVVGGRFVQGSDIPQPQSPWVLIPAGALLIGLGALPVRPDGFPTAPRKQSRRPWPPRDRSTASSP